MNAGAQDPRAVVVGIDDSDSARNAADWAADLAAIWSAPLALVHVVPGRIDEPPIEVIPDWMRELADAAERSGVTSVGTEVVAGGAVELLLDRAKGARLLVVGSYGEGAWSGMLAGSTALTLVGRAACPVAVVRGSAPQIAPPRGGHVVVGVDGTAAGDAALAYAAELALSLGAGLLAVHAWSDVMPDESGAPHRLPDEWSVLAERAAATLRQHLEPVLARHPQLAVESRVVAGRPLRAMLEFAADARAVVVGPREDRPAVGMLLGSTSRGLVEFAPCPVLVARG